MRQTSQGQALRLNNPAGLTKSAGEPLGSHVDLAGGELLVFDKPSYGIRALAVELQKLEQEQGKATLGDVVRRWAAFKGADPERYFDAVAKHIAEPDRVLDLTSHADLRAAVETVIRSELSRMPYSDAQFVKGLVLAGIEPARRPLDHSRTLRAGITAVLLLSLAVLAEAVRTEPNRAEALVRDTVPALLPSFLEMQTHLTSIVWSFDAFLFVALGFMIWARIDDRRKGLR